MAVVELSDEAVFDLARPKLSGQDSAKVVLASLDRGNWRRPLEAYRTTAELERFSDRVPAASDGFDAFRGTGAAAGLRTPREGSTTD